MIQLYNTFVPYLQCVINKIDINSNVILKEYLIHILLFCLVQVKEKSFHEFVFTVVIRDFFLSQCLCYILEEYEVNRMIVYSYHFKAI